MTAPMTPSERARLRALKTAGRLGTIAWGMRHFGSLLTNRQFPRRDMMRLVGRGLVRSVGFVEPCDDDGCFLPGRAEREGFELTRDGWAFLCEQFPNDAEYRLGLAAAHASPGAPRE